MTRSRDTAHARIVCGMEIQKVAMWSVILRHVSQIKSQELRK